ncbi:sensor histidine kinase [Aureimonas psammosilenae]|uniref:sensor histidine kinase n=1 Tax=Aureimonas psammosilenae TaxID=2495496 RepID=UPI0018699027|nr:HWE histidine kinase domain-containing protein [Aureimonas psammosilenae]
MGTELAIAAWEMTSGYVGCLAGGGECGELLRKIDWARNPLGSPETWPIALQSAVRMLLHSRFGMMVHWGPDLVTFYNDAYAPSLGTKHPGQLGRRAKEWWSEMWDDLAPIFETVRRGEAFYVENAAYHPDRAHGRQTAYFTHCHSPLWGDTGEIEGVFLVVTETTRQVVAEAELKALNVDLKLQADTNAQDRDRIWNLSVDLLGVADFDGVWLNVSPAWTTVLGWNAAEVVGRTSQWLEHPDDQAKTQAEIKRLAKGATTWEFTNRFRTQDGTYRTLSWRAVPTDGLLYCVARDVTAELAQTSRNDALNEALGLANQELLDQREADRVRQVLQRELSHRLKNSFAMVQAIVSQSVRNSPSAADAGKAITARVQALSNAQDILVRALNEGADVAEVITTSLRPHVGADHAQVSMEGPPAFLSAQQGMGLALAVHELATNAAKYGGLSVPNGRIVVQWYLTDDNFCLLWIEKGGPPVTLPERQGFGSRLLTRIVPSYFTGNASLAYAPDGVRYELNGTIADDRR